MAIGQKSLRFRNESGSGTPTNRDHEIRGADVTLLLFIGEGDLYGGSVGSAEPPRLYVNGKRNFVGGTSITFRVSVSKNAEIRNDGKISGVGATWTEFYAQTLTLAQLNDFDQEDLINFILPQTEDFLGAKALRVVADVTGTFTAGNINAGLKISVSSPDDFQDQYENRASHHAGVPAHPVRLEA